MAPIIGGLLTEKASWRWCKSILCPARLIPLKADTIRLILGFYINLPFGAITLIIISLIRIPERREKIDTNPTLYESINRLDIVGFLLFAPACVMILLALQWGGSTYAWNSSQTIGLFVGFVACLAAFFFWEKRRGDTAMIPLAILAKKVVYSSCIVSITQYGSLQVFSYYLPVWFQTILGVNPILSGAYFIATAGPFIASNIITGIIGGYCSFPIVQYVSLTSGDIGKTGSPAIYTMVGNSLATIGGGLMSTFTPSTHTGVWVGYQVLAGAGRGMTLQRPVNAVQHILDPSQMSVGTSMVLFCQFFGGALALALAETDFSASLRSSLKTYAPGVNATLIFDVGASGVRDVVSSEELPGVLRAYNHSIMNTFVSLSCFLLNTSRSN